MILAEGNRRTVRRHFVVQVFRRVIQFPPVSNVTLAKSNCKNVEFIIQFIGQLTENTVLLV